VHPEKIRVKTNNVHSVEWLYHAPQKYPSNVRPYFFSLQPYFYILI
jgi:hypothetical protein